LKQTESYYTSSAGAARKKKTKKDRKFELKTTVISINIAGFTSNAT